MLAWRYPMQDMEIQNGGQLTVRESQLAVFVDEGKIADVFGPGLHTLYTRNLPLLTDLMNWDKGFESPFKSDVYFFSTRLQMDAEVGHGDSDYDSREGIWRGAAARLRDLFVPDQGSAEVFHRGERNARYVLCFGSGRAAAGNDCGADDGCFCGERCAVSRHGDESGGAGRENYWCGAASRLRRWVSS